MKIGRVIFTSENGGILVSNREKLPFDSSHDVKQGDTVLFTVVKDPATKKVLAIDLLVR
jgi:hypothetical protein